MGPEPIPTLDIEFDAIQNELQRKLVEEIYCVACGQFPFSPMQCRKCDKLFCKNCVDDLNKGKAQNEDFGEHSKSPRNRASTNRSMNPQSTPTPGGAYCCPNCNEGGDFIVEVNKVVRNCIDFCEFPHKCWLDG